MTTAPLEGEKILITGATGAIALPVARHLAASNEVWGVARFTDPALRRELDEAGVKTVPVDLEKDDLDAIPDDITVVLHYAYTRRPSGQFHDAIQLNAIGAGHVLAKCREAKAALVVSAATLYSFQEDPYHAYDERDDIGFVHAPWGPTSPVSKVTLEATARFCAEAFELPTTIVRPAAPYGTGSDVASVVLDSVFEDRPVFVTHDPQPYTVIHIDDMCDQIPALLGAASIPATVLNWGADEVVTVQEMAAQAGEALGRTPSFQVANLPGVARGAVLDTTRVRAVVGPCKRNFREAFGEIIAARKAG